MILAADVVTLDSLTLWVIGAVLTAGVGSLGFLLRHSFDVVTKSIEGLGSKLDGLKADLAKGDGDRRVLEARLVAVERTLEKLERILGQASDGGTR